MGTSLDLLRMLEPTLRPDGVSGVARAASQPIESRSFEALLDEAQSAASQSGDAARDAGASGSETAEPVARRGPNLIDRLAQVDVIENPSLRSLLNRGATPSPHNGVQA